LPGYSVVNVLQKSSEKTFTGVKNIRAEV